MPLLFNGQAVENVTYNGVDLEKVNFNGVTVFEKTPKFYPYSLNLGDYLTAPIADGNTTYTQWRVWEKNYGNDIEGNPDALVLFVLDKLRPSSRYWDVKPSSAYANKYRGSNLDTTLNTTWYNAMPDTLRNAIYLTTIPVRESASSGAGQDYLQRYVFTPSSVEWGLGGSAYEGSSLGLIRMSYSPACEQSTYLTREPVGGMADYVYTVNGNGVRNNSSVTANFQLRPCFCLDPDTELEQIDSTHYRIKA